MSAPFLLEITIKATLVLLAAWTATRLMSHRTSAAARHLVWTAAIGAVLTLPAVVQFGPAWRVAAVPDRWIPAAVATRAAAPTGHADAEVWPSRPPESTHAPASAVAGGAPASRVQRILSSTVVWNASWPALLLLVWGVGAAAALVSLIAGLCSAWWVARGAQPVTDPRWLRLRQEASARLGVTRVVPLRSSDRIAVPVACGILRPSLLVPRDAVGWDDDRRRIVLLHELSHVRRRDCLVQALAQLAWAMHWFNPIFPVVLSRLRLEQESACDDLVLEAGMKPADYASHLVDIASTPRSSPVPLWAALAIARRSRLEVRVAAILDTARSRRLPSLRSSIAVTAIAAASAVSLGAVRASVAVHAIDLLPSLAVTAMGPYASLMPDQRGLVTTEPLPLAALPNLAVAPQELTPDSARAFLASCTGCHSATRKVANVVLESADVERIGENPELWERVVRKLRSGTHLIGTSPPTRLAADAFSTSVEAALDRAAQSATAPEPVGQEELAARLARFLWNADPDEPLLSLARKGALAGATLEEQVRRLVADRRSDAFVDSFFGDWLYLKNMGKMVQPQPQTFPDFDEDLRQAFQREASLFLASQIREDRGVIDLLTAKDTFLNERLAGHYGIDSVKGPEFRRVTLSDDRRAGILGKAAVLAVTSFAHRTSPVLRGKYVLEQFLGVQAPPPPPNVPAMSEAGEPRSGRARLEEHRKNPACAACHASMDPIGFALENFDAIGRWRDTDAGSAIDASGSLADGTTFNGPAQLRSMLVDRRDAVVRTVTLRLLAHAVGRRARYSDMPAVRTIVWEAAPTNYKWSSLLAGVVKSASFQAKQIE